MNIGAWRSLLVAAVLVAAWGLKADIPTDARTAEANARRTTELKLLARAAEARGDLLTCAACAEEAERIANRTDELKQQVIAEYNQLPPAQQAQVRGAKEAVIADATGTRMDADAIKQCARKYYLVVAAFLLFLAFLYWWVFWRGLGPFFRESG
jgi:hypothetical protein